MSIKAQSAALRQPNQPTPSDKSAADGPFWYAHHRACGALFVAGRMDIRLRVVGSLLRLSSFCRFIRPSAMVRRLMPCPMAACRFLRWGLLG